MIIYDWKLLKYSAGRHEMREQDNTDNIKSTNPGTDPTVFKCWHELGRKKYSNFIYRGK